jgi:hypothetical protein
VKLDSPVVRRRIARFTIFAISLIVVLAGVAVMLWLDGVLPQRLIPWVPVDRL